MLVTLDTSHSPIGPCRPLEQSPTGDSSRHALTAPLSSILDCGENDGGEGNGGEDNGIEVVALLRSTLDCGEDNGDDDNGGDNNGDEDIGVGVVAHTVCDIDPDEPANMNHLPAFE